MKKEIIGIILFFLVILTSISLFSYTSDDPCITNHFFSTSPNIGNFFGLLGANVAGIMMWLFGFGAFWIPILLLLCAIRYIKGRSNKNMVFILAGIFLIISTSCIIALLHTQYGFWETSFACGGIIGFPITFFLLKYTNFIGSIIIILFFFVIGFVVLTRLSMITFFLNFKKYLLNLFLFLTNKIKQFFLFLKTFFQSLYDNHKNAFYKNSNSQNVLSEAYLPADTLSQQLKGKEQQPVITERKDKNLKMGCIESLKIKEDKGFTLPSVSLLDDKKNVKTSVNTEKLKKNGELLEKKLHDFGISGEVVEIMPGPVITTFEYRPATGIKISKIVNLTDDLALALKALSIRIIAPIPGKDVVGVEIPNDKREIVNIKELLSADIFIKAKSMLTLGLGKDISGAPVITKMDSMPHLLIAGATGTGKSVGLNSMIISLLYKASPDQVKFIMIDPKRIELSVYDGIPHLISPVVTDMKKATNALFWAVHEMEKRYTLFAETGVRNILQYNNMIEKSGNYKIKKLSAKTQDSNIENKETEKVLEKIPYIVIIVDEFADLMMVASRDVEHALIRLAQMARAAGLHLILATQRPSVDVLTGIIKANFPTRISFQVSSKIDSRTILDTNGSEKLLGNGDMLFLPPSTGRLQRIQGAYISEEEISRVTEYLKNQRSPEYVNDITAKTKEEDKKNDDIEYDEKYDEAVALVTRTRQASISSVQRYLRVGYNRAARMIETMEKEGVIGPQEGSKPREVLVKSHED
ncbi:MAG: cell division protein FtsK [Desulfobacteraceae bacterium 4572_130]|nr:MAG: cell division protein FtsK [Desulfobacteraceae bacterium 4572_130]